MHDVGAEGGRLLARFAQAVEIALDIADDRGDLRERDDEAVADGGGHEEMFALAKKDAQSPGIHPSTWAGAARSSRGKPSAGLPSARRTLPEVARVPRRASVASRRHRNSSSPSPAFRPAATSTRRAPTRSRLRRGPSRPKACWEKMRQRLLNWKGVDIDAVGVITPTINLADLSARQIGEVQEERR